MRAPAPGMRAPGMEERPPNRLGFGPPECNDGPLDVRPITRPGWNIGGPKVKFRDATVEELAPRKPRPLSPRQLAIQKRDQQIVKLLNEIAVGPALAIKKIELEEKEKLATIRLVVARQVDAHPATIHMGVRGGAIYLSRSPIPGGRGRKPKGA
jgi:hypothetical protein